MAAGNGCVDGLLILEDSSSLGVGASFAILVYGGVPMFYYRSRDSGEATIAYMGLAREARIRVEVTMDVADMGRVRPERRAAAAAAGAVRAAVHGALEECRANEWKIPDQAIAIDLFMDHLEKTLDSAVAMAVPGVRAGQLVMIGMRPARIEFRMDYEAGRRAAERLARQLGEAAGIRIGRVVEAPVRGMEGGLAPSMAFTYSYRMGGLVENISTAAPPSKAKAIAEAIASALAGKPDNTLTRGILETLPSIGSILYGAARVRAEGAPADAAQAYNAARTIYYLDLIDDLHRTTGLKFTAVELRPCETPSLPGGGVISVCDIITHAAAGTIVVPVKV